MQSRVYVTSGVRPSVCLSYHPTAAVVCFLLRTVLAGGIKQQQRPPDARHLAANASSVTLSAVVGSSTQSYFFCICTENTHTHTHLFNGPFSGTTQVSRYQKGKTNLDFTEARHNEWQWHQLGHMHVCTLLQTDNHASTSPLKFLHAGCPSCRPTSSVKALKGYTDNIITVMY